MLGLMGWLLAKGEEALNGLRTLAGGFQGKGPVPDSLVFGQADSVPEAAVNTAPHADAASSSASLPPLANATRYPSVA